MAAEVKQGLSDNLGAELGVGISVEQSPYQGDIKRGIVIVLDPASKLGWTKMVPAHR